MIVTTPTYTVGNQTSVTAVLDRKRENPHGQVFFKTKIEVAEYYLFGGDRQYIATTSYNSVTSFIMTFNVLRQFIIDEGFERGLMPLGALDNTTRLPDGQVTLDKWYDEGNKNLNSHR